MSGNAEITEEKYRQKVFRRNFNPRLENKYITEPGAREDNKYNNIVARE